MRVHRLEIEAIGPFAERQTVDFDRLNEAGIFLLAGPTGSGKTSVLDAISIALFGEPPGARRRGRDTVSHHRRPDQVPEVRLEATLGQRRIRVTRRPAYRRPKLRGDGETEVNPSVTLEVQDPAGEWQPVSSRISEADGQLREWLGMDGGQFAQVVMLPQGEFATFLRADARDRRRLLERLFPTHDFAFVERWLRDQAARARQVRDDKRSEIEQQLAAAAAVAEAGIEAPGDPGGERVQSELLGFGAGEAGGEGEQSTSVAAGGGLAVKAPESGSDQPSIRVPDMDDPGAVPAWTARVKDQLAAASARANEAQTETRQRLERAEKLLRAAEDRSAQIERCSRDEQQAIGEWNRVRTELAGGPDPEELPADPGRQGVQTARKRERALRAQVTELEAFERDGIARRTELIETRTALVAEMEEAESDRAELTAIQAEAPTQINRLEELLRKAESAAVGLEGAEQAVGALSERLTAARKRDALAPQLELAEQAVQDERELALATRERWLHLRETRLAGIAAELAAGLESGAACPVCGAEDHPQPATATADAPSKEDEEAAEEELASRELAVEEARARCEALQQEHHQLDGRAGGLAVDQLASERREAERKRDLLRERAAERERLAATLEKLRNAQSESAGRLAELEGKLARLGERRAACEAEVEEINRREDILRRDDAGVPERRRRLFATAELLHRAGEAAFRAGEAARARVAAESVELELGLEDALDLHREAKAEYESAASRAAKVEGRQKDFEREAAALPKLIEEYEPLVEAAAVATELSGLAQGNNPARLQLSTYVLAARLEQVIEAANRRLAPMSSGRYRLVYSAELAGRGAISGLGIRVLDAHTGLEREASSLSGGESFYASLSLALGLAEVVQSESGGRRLETLFIDEGFGSLDSDTLDQVMAVLDELRDGGRVIGLVSHVEELKTRIPSRIEVTPTPAGSSLALVGI